MPAMRPAKIIAGIFAVAGLITLFAVDNHKVSNACMVVAILLSLVDDYRSGALKRDITK